MVWKIPEKPEPLSDLDWQIIGRDKRNITIAVSDDPILAGATAEALEKLAYRLKFLSRGSHTYSRRTVHMEIAAEIESAKRTISAAIKEHELSAKESAEQKPEKARTVKTVHAA